jgi:hypothetical protein
MGLEEAVTARLLMGRRRRGCGEYDGDGGKLR